MALGRFEGGEAVTHAVLLAVSAPERTERLVAQLREAGAGAVRVGGGGLIEDLRAIAEAARANDGPLLVCTDDLVAHTAALRTLLTEPGGGSVALVGGEPAAGQAGVREERGLVAAAGVPGPERASGAFLGALRVGAADLVYLAGCAERLAADRLFSAPTDAASAADLLLAELLATGVRVHACRVRLLVAERAADPASLRAAQQRVDEVDEEAARLRLAVKEKDDFFATYAVSSFSPHLVRWAARLGLSPTAVTAISVLLAAVAALAFTTGDRPAMVAGALLLYASFVLDCVDGQLARYNRQFSAFGGWLDTMADRGKEYLVYAGLAAGADAWPLAIAAMTLQTVRHMTDYWYGALHDQAVTLAPAAGATGLGARLGQASERVQARGGSVAYWLKRTVVFPIGERWALIAVSAALFGGRVALIAVLVWGGLAMAYTLSLRALRSRAMRVAVLDTVDTAAHRDDGPLARRYLPVLGAPLPLAGLATLAAAGLVVAGLVLAGLAGGPAVLGLPTGLGGRLAVPVAAAFVLLAALPARAPHTGPLDWLVPAALRAAEYLFVIGVGVVCGVPLPWIFALLCALALRHYDRTARLEKRAGAADWRPWDIGWEGRVTVLALCALAGVATPAVVLLTGYVVVMFCTDLLASWVGRAAPRPAR